MWGSAGVCMWGVMCVCGEWRGVMWVCVGGDVGVCVCGECVCVCMWGVMCVCVCVCVCVCGVGGLSPIHM